MAAVEYEIENEEITNLRVEADTIGEVAILLGTVLSIGAQS